MAQICNSENLEQCFPYKEFTTDVQNISKDTIHLSEIKKQKI